MKPADSLSVSEFPGANDTPGRSAQHNWPELSVGVITTEKRAGAFAKMLHYLKTAVSHYPGSCELIVGNNSGAEAYATINELVDTSDIRAVCNCTIVNSKKNNIATGRNTVIDSANFELIAFLDDDEYPEAAWLLELVNVLQEHECSLVAGPIIPMYESASSAWVKTIDIHNIEDQCDGAVIDFAASGNFLMDRNRIGKLRLNEEYGKTGGSDTEYFLRLGDAGHITHWAAKARVFEDIPVDRATARYAIRRSISQGNNYRRVLESRGEIHSITLFKLRAIAIFVLSLPIGCALMLVSHQATGKWMKRAFSNLGKLYRPSKLLYG